jgi:hypothetical protein
MNTTQTFWDVDGVSLQTYAYNIQTWGGDAQAPPPLRGDDVLVPHQVGRTWTPRVPDSRTITFGMWVVGANKDGSIPESGISRQLFERNWAMLRKLLWTPRRQVKLTKRFRVPGSSKVHTASAMAQFSGGLNPAMTGRTRAQFTVDLLLSDPYFYGDELEIEIDPQEPVQEFEVLGDDRTTAVSTEVTGLTKRLRVTNSTDEQNPVWFEYSRALDRGQKALIDSQMFTATHDTEGASTPSSGNVYHEGSDHWMELEPGLVKLGVSEQDVPSRGTVWTNLSTNPSFERVNGNAAVRTNGILNPSFERASTNALMVWRTNLCPSPDMATDRANLYASSALTQPDSGQAGDFTVPTGGPFHGGYRTMEIISSPLPQAPGITFYGDINREKGISITGGLTYAASIYVRGESQPLVGVPLQLFMRWFGPNNQNAEVTSTTFNGTMEWQRAYNVAVAPAWATEVIFGIRVAPSVITGGTFLSVASVLLEKSSEIQPFFSGASSPGMLNAQYSWKSTAGVSQSVMALSAPTTYRNDVVNPSFEGEISSSAVSINVTAVRSNAWASTGSYSLQLSGSSTESNASYLAPDGDNGALRFQFSPGGRYTVMAKRRLNAPLTGTLHSRAGRIAVYTKEGNSEYVETTSAQLENVAGVSDVRVTFTVPAGATEAFVRLYHGGFPGSGSIWWDDLLVTPVGFDSELGYVGNYFDGDTPNTKTYSYSWDTSTERFGSKSTQRAIAPSQVFSNSLASSTGIAFMSRQYNATSERPTSLQIQPTGASNFTFSTLLNAVMLPNRSYLLRGKVYQEKAQSSGVHANARKITVAWEGYPGYLTVVSEKRADNTPGWSEYTAIINTPPTGSLIAVYLWNGGSERDGSVWWDDILVTDSADSSVAYFDGSMTGSDFQGSWTGTPGASTSIQSAPAAAGVSSGPAAAVYQAADWALSGTKSLRITPTSLTSNDTYANVAVDLPAGSYTIMATVRLKATQSGALHDRARRIWMTDSDRQYLSHAAPNAAGDYEIRWNITTTGRVLLFRLYNGASANMGDVWWDGLVIIKQDEDRTPYTGPYFDGSTKDTQYADYEWTGAAHASTSIIRGVSSTENVKIRYRPVWL